MSRELLCRYDPRSLVILDSDREWVFSADPRGRIIWVHTPQSTYRRSRNNQWYLLKREHWRRLEPLAKNEIEHAVETWRPVWKRAHRQARGPLARHLENWIERFLGLHEEDGERFRSIYPNIPILPPDAYQALYIQLSSGCPWNRCVFCNFYRDREYRVSDMDELRRHLAAVRTYWEGAIGSRSGVFLGDANAAAIPTEALTERCRLVHEVFREPQFRALQAFSDFFSASKRYDRDFERLHEIGLRRVCFGVESGHKELLDQIRKPFHPDDVVRVLHRARAGGVQVSLIFIVGLGGRRHRESHFESSMELVSRSSLKRPDRIYLSPLTLEPDLGYVEIADEREWGNLDDEEVESEMHRWRETIRSIDNQLPVSLYNIRLFTY